MIRICTFDCLSIAKSIALKKLDARALPLNVVNKEILLKYISFIFVILCLAACTSNYTIRSQSSPVKNQTEFVFPYSAEDLAEKLAHIFSISNQIENQIPLSRSPRSGVFTAKAIKLDTKTYQFDFDNTGVNFWRSDFYSVNGENAKTTGEFKLVLEQIGEQSTKVKVIATLLQVINGVECCGPHGRYARYTNVAPTTIEEYAFLYFIGEQLGIQMTPVKRISNTNKPSKKSGDF